MITTGLNISEKKNEIIVDSIKYNNDKMYQSQIDQKLINTLKR